MKREVKFHYRHRWSLLLVFAAVLSLTSVAFGDVLVDNGDAGTSFTGTWPLSGGTTPYGDDSVWSRDGATYTWQFDSEPAGTYEVLMWWSGWPSRAANIAVDVSHSGGTYTLAINQQVNAGQWNSLGSYYFDTSGSVRMTAAAGSAVSTCADAVWFRLVSGNMPPVASIDMISPSPAEPGQLVTFQGSGTASEGAIAAFLWESSLDGVLSESATFSMGLTEGTHTISLTVQDEEGLWSEPATQSLVVGTIPTELIIDNRDAATSQSGTWYVSGASDPYDADSVWSRDGTTFAWHFAPPQAGDYEVFIWWTEWSSRSSAVPVTIQYDGGDATVTVNQQANGGQWNSLGIFHFDPSGDGLVSIVSQPGPSSTCADAVRFNLVQNNDAPTAVIDSILPTPADPGEEVAFSGHGEDTDGSIVAYAWTSSIDGSLSDQTSFSTTTLSEGVHTITFEVQDNVGVWSAPATASLSVGNIAPEAFIDSISPNPSGLEDTITFSGHGEDSDGTITGYLWESDLAGFLSDQPTFTRSANDEGGIGQGVHIIFFSVMDEDGEWSPAVTETLIVGNAPPTATIDSVSPNPANIGQTVAFQGTGEDMDGTVTAYSWDSDLDGHLSDLASFAASGLSRGNHTISFTVYDDDGAASPPATVALTVDEIPEEVETDNGGAGTSFTGAWYVSGASNYYGTDSLWSRDGATYTWTFTPTSSSYYEIFMWWTEWPSRSTSVPIVIEYAGGTTTVYVNQQVDGGQWNSLGEYFFNAGTPYHVTITAQPGPTSTCVDAMKFVQVFQPSPPVAGFTAGNLYGGAPFAVQFTDTSLGSVTGWLWDFGDGETSAAQNPSHEYASPGDYTVSLTATNASGSDTETKQHYIHIVASAENIYLCDGYAHDALFIPHTIQMLQGMGAVDNGGVWVYTNTANNITYFIHTVRTPEDMEAALREQDAHLIINGHANFGLGLTFATAEEVYAQEIDDIQFIDDDRFMSFSTDMVSVKVDGIKYGQAYPNWEPIYSDYTSGTMPYTFDEGLPPFNYYLKYEIDGDPNTYTVELADGSYLQRFPDASVPAWNWPNGSAPPDPVLNPEYFITNTDPDFNRFEVSGNWPLARVPGAGYMGEAGYLGYNYQYHAPGSGLNTATWTLLVKYPGIYAVLASWFPDPANATNAKYTIQHAAGSDTVEVDQRTTEMANALGGFYFDEGAYTFQLSDDADGTVIADAVILSALDNPEKILQSEFRANVVTGSAPLTVQFVALGAYYSLSDVADGIVSWYWDFGDGTHSTLENPTHTYSSPGLYTVTLTVADAEDGEATEVKTDFISVGTTPPIQAEFTSLNRLGSDRTVVDFIDQSGGDVTGWQWDFGDGSPLSTEQNPTHIYNEPGAYTVTLTVSGHGGTDTEAETDFVQNIIGLIYADNTFQHKPHFYSRITGSPITFGKVILDARRAKIPEDELGYTRMFYGSCNSCSYYVGTFHRGEMYCTTSDSEVYTADEYLQAYLLGYSDQEILSMLNSTQPIHEFFDFNQPPPSLR